jgi:colanic acid/amylovoran biosynthesis glycosyltransferase
MGPSSLDEGISVLVAAESFPNFLQSYVLNSIEEILRRGGGVTIAAGRRLGKQYPQRVDRLTLLDRTRYFRLDSIRGVLGGLRPYALPFTRSGRQAYRGLWTLTTSRRWRSRSLRHFVKAVVEAPLLAESRFNLVHAHNLIPAYEFLMVPQVLGIPLVTTFHGLPTIGGSGKLAEEKAAEVFEQGDVFLVNTRFAQRQLEGIGCPTGKIRVLPQGIRIEDYPFQPKACPSSAPVVLLTVARLSVEKGHRYALEAVCKLRAAGRKLEYRIVGIGYEKENLERLVRELQLQDCVHFFGEVSEGELQRHHREAHLFILPSVEDPEGFHTETQGVVIQEAQASGAIVVASATGGIPECVDDGRSAFLVRERDPQALAQRIAGVLDHPNHWETWQHAARAWVENHFAMEKIGKRLWDIYREVIKARPPRQV